MMFTFLMICFVKLKMLCFPLLLSYFIIRYVMLLSQNAQNNNSFYLTYGNFSGIKMPTKFGSEIVLIIWWFWKGFEKSTIVDDQYSCFVFLEYNLNVVSDSVGIAPNWWLLCIYTCNSQSTADELASDFVREYK